MPARTQNSVLGIDLGPASIGWALVDYINGEPAGIRAVGCRTFKMGLQLTGTGKGKTANADRRTARHQRRGIERHAERLRRLAGTLQQASLLPPGDVRNSTKRHLILNDLDKKIDSPYKLRAKALDHELELYELGRIFYHLCQRRGFKSGRKAEAKADEKLGEVMKGIRELDDNIHQADKRTYGEYFSTEVQIPLERIRNRYTSRQRYDEEFDLIWNKQAQFHPTILTKRLKRAIRRAIFFQRPLRSQKHLVGFCELEFHKRRRAPRATLLAQRFRYLQIINNLRYTAEPGSPEVSLNDTQRASLRELFEYPPEIKARKKDGTKPGCKVTFAQIRGRLDLLRTAKFNYERNEEELFGNTTTAAFAFVIGCDVWKKLTEDQKNTLVLDHLSIREVATFRRALRRRLKKWLGKEDFDKIAEKINSDFSLTLDDGYCNYSQKALKRILPHLENGLELSEAVKKEYGRRPQPPFEELPPLHPDNYRGLKNPLVDKALAELRVVVNQIIARYGKPDLVRIELGRDLRQSKKDRTRETEKNNKLRELRTKAVKCIKEFNNNLKPTSDAIRRVLLMWECGCLCPYTGKVINMSDLFGVHPHFQTEHIIPWSRCLDNSFKNLTLCHVDANRQKANRTPREAYYVQDLQAYQDILSRVKRFVPDVMSLSPERIRSDEDAAPDQTKGGKNKKIKVSGKLERFLWDDAQVTKFCESFTEGNLNDMRWASKKAREYLGQLYGCAGSTGVAQGKTVVQASSGRITAELRYAWGLNSILGQDGKKTRDDHRHHAVDALVVALTEPRTVKRLNDAAARAEDEKARLQGDHLKIRMDEPWKGFRQEAEKKIQAIVPSNVSSHRVSGALHEDNYYGRRQEAGKIVFTVRKAVHELKPNQIENIFDEDARKAVAAKCEQLNLPKEKEMKKLENDPARVRSRNGNEFPVKRVRIVIREKPKKIGKKPHRRWVLTDENHHLEISKETGKDGSECWEGRIVSMLDAYRRKATGAPIVLPTASFTLSLGDAVKTDPKKVNRYGSVDCWRVCGIYNARIKGTNVPKVELVPIHAARTKVTEENDQDKGQDKGHKIIWTASIDQLQKFNSKKISVSPLGEIRPAND